MRLILMGTPDFVVPIFDKIANQHEIIAIFTRAPKPVGRKHILTKTPVHEWAIGKNIPVETNIKNIENYARPDFILIVAYGIILKQNVLDFAPCINIHPSNLPMYRGPSPIQTAIKNGDTESAVCLMQVTPEVDSGDVLLREKFTIDENDTTLDVEDKVAKIGADIALKFLDNPSKFQPVPQIGTPTFTTKFGSVDELIDWSASPREIHNHIRAITGRAKINGIDVKILKSKIKDDKLEIITIQPAGKKAMSWHDFINGIHGAQIKFGE